MGAMLRSGFRLAWLAALLALPVAASAAAPSPPRAAAKFGRETASPSARRAASWVIGAGDNGALPFMIIDKPNAKIFAFDRRGLLVGASPVLLGLARGDVSVPGIGSRAFSATAPGERITPAGRFVASLGENLAGRDVLWVDYDAGIALHRVITTNPSEHRLQRLASKSALERRISYGCINVPVAFYERVVHPLFAATGIVYILPDMQTERNIFLDSASAPAPIPGPARSQAKLED
jgi:hypothetical protein